MQKIIPELRPDRGTEDRSTITTTTPSCINGPCLRATQSLTKPFTLHHRTASHVLHLVHHQTDNLLETANCRFKIEVASQKRQEAVR